MIRRRQPSERDLAALADGSLPASRRPRVERAVAASPELQADVDAQRRALAVMSVAAEERAPSSLRARLELARDPVRRRRVPLRRLAVMAPAAATVAAVLALTVGTGTTGAPTVATAATLASRAPLAPVAPAAAGSTSLRTPSAAGLSFPDWARAFGLEAVGMRRDTLDGRLATTVYYARAGQRVAYTIVSGDALAAGTSTRATAWDGLRLSSFQSHGRAVVTWLRRGHSCVLSGNPGLLSELMRLAAWHPGEYQG